MKTSPIAKMLRSSRVKAGLSQFDVAETLGYKSAQFVSNWERGISSPPLKALKTLAKLYNLNADELLETMIEETKKQMIMEYKSSKVLA